MTEHKNTETAQDPQAGETPAETLPPTDNTPTRTLDEFSENAQVPKLEKTHIRNPIRTLWRFLKAKRYFSLFVLLPWLICFVYITLIATPEYESSASIVIEQNGSQGEPVINVGFLGQSGGQNANNDYLAQNFIDSRTMLNYLVQHAQFEKYFQNHHIDWISRLKSDPDQQALLKYYQSKVLVNYDQLSQSMKISMRAFDAKHAESFLNIIVTQTKLFVNKVANTLAYVQYRFSQTQLQNAKDKLYRAESKMLLFQKTYQMFDPTQAATVISSVVGQLKTDLVQKQTQLITYASYMRPNASQIVALKEQIAAIKQQISNQSSMLLGTDKATGADGHINSVLAQYEWVRLALKFAETEYTAANNAYEEAKINLSKQQNVVVTVEKTNLPDDYTYPKKAYDLITIFVALVIAFMLGKIIFIIVQEHRD